MPRLGDGEYKAMAVDNRTGAPVSDLSQWIIRGQWDRRIDDIADAQITVVAKPECCAFLEKVAVTRHDLAIFRNGEIVFQGPIVQIRSRGDGIVRIVARDVVWWLTRRLIHNDYDFEGNPINAVTYAVKIIRDAMEPDDRGVLANLEYDESGADETERTVTASTRNAYQEIRDLADITIDYTTIGKTLYVVGEQFKFGTVAYLNDSHFQNNIEVVEDGQNFTTEVTFSGNNGNTIKKAGGVDGFYGLLEGVVRDSRTKDEATAERVAENNVQKYPPILIAGEGGAFLQPTAPVDANSLIAGALLRISLLYLCKPVSQLQRIEAVEVNWDNEIGEQFGLRLGPADVSREVNFTAS